jgi:hypothetical protein
MVIKKQLSNLEFRLPEKLLKLLEKSFNVREFVRRRLLLTAAELCLDNEHVVENVGLLRTTVRGRGTDTFKFSVIN